MKAIHASSAIGALFLCSAQVLAQSAQRETPLIDEIIVTAQKREQRLQDVPVTVSVVSAGDLQHLNINDTIDLARAVPALQVVGGGSGAIQIRGIGTIGYSANSEPSVATVIDGVVMPSEETVKNGQYMPLSRPIFIYVSDIAAARPEVRSFVKFYLDNANFLVSDVGYIPLTNEEYKIELAKFEAFLSDEASDGSATERSRGLSVNIIPSNLLP